MKYAFFLDIDGTLIYEGKLPQRNVEAIDEARKKGHYVFINTGRSKAVMQPVIKEDLELDGYVTSLGAYIEVGGKAIHEDCATKESLNKIYPAIIKYAPLVGGESICIASPDRVLKEIKADAWLTSPDDLPENTIHKLSMLGVASKEDADIIMEDFEMYQHETYFEICPKGNSKATGIKRVKDYLGTDIVTVAIGDSLNDIPMFEGADYCVAMGDGVEVVKEMADYVSCKAADGGVGEAIEYFCKREDI